MAKRFTDQNKWDDPWFDELPLRYKMAWIYLCDKCDIAGFWKPSMRNMCHSLGESFSLNELYDVMNGRLVKCGDKFFIPSFIRFQNGTLKPTNNCHLAIIDILQSNGYDKNIQPLMSPLGAPHEESCNGNGNGNGNVIPRLEEYTEGVKGEISDPIKVGIFYEVIANGPEKWKAEEMQGSQMWGKWTQEIPNNWKNQLSDIASKYKIYTDIRLAKDKIDPMSLRNWLSSGEYMKNYPVTTPTTEPKKETEWESWNRQKANLNRK